MIGADDQFCDQAEENELNTYDETEYGKKEEGIAVSLHSIQELLVKRCATQKSPDGKSRKAKSPEEIHRFRRIAAQKLDGNQVEEYLESPSQAVF